MNDVIIQKWIDNICWKYFTNLQNGYVYRAVKDEFKIFLILWELR